MTNHPSTNRPAEDASLESLFRHAEDTVTVDENDLAHRKQALLQWMTEESDGNGADPHSDDETGPRWLTVSEAARLLGTSERTVLHLMVRKELTSVAGGDGVHRIHEQTVRDFLAASSGALAPATSTARQGSPGSERPLNEVKFLTVAETASVMRVSKMTVYRLVHGGHLPAIRVGRSFRVPEQAIHEYLRESFQGVETESW